MNQSGKKTLWATVAIVAMIVLAFCMTSVPAVQQAMAQMTNHPVYQSSADGISLISIYEGDWAPLLSTCTRAADKQIYLTIALPVETILSGGARSRRIRHGSQRPIARGMAAGTTAANRSGAKCNPK